MAQDVTRRSGTTKVGGAGRGEQGILHVTAQSSKGTGTANKPSLVALDAVADNGTITTYWLWVDSTGDLRIANAIPTNQDGDGAVVGGQS